ncbi:MAG TPA: hypothetical protein VMU76_10350 [Acidimicrobiales bacterium]|nr:hypothetical protein [Acidimicrobiales bacterium]
MNGEDRAWLAVEVDDCVDSWRAVSETEGPNSHEALLWKGRADQALRSAIHFSVVSPEDGRRRMATLTPDPGSLRAFAEPDGEDED